MPTVKPGVFKEYQIWLCISDCYWSDFPGPLWLVYPDSNSFKIQSRFNSITERQKLTIEKGLCDYHFIMANWKNDDHDFREVYYDFYLIARWAVMSKSNNLTPYFNLLRKLPASASIFDVLDNLKSTMEKSSYELSLGSKLLHTRNDIYRLLQWLYRRL